jgi:hypothetical protein
MFRSSSNSWRESGLGFEGSGAEGIEQGENRKQKTEVRSQNNGQRTVEY